MGMCAGREGDDLEAYACRISLSQLQAAARNRAGCFGRPLRQASRYAAHRFSTHRAALARVLVMSLVSHMTLVSMGATSILWRRIRCRDAVTRHGGAL